MFGTRRVDVPLLESLVCTRKPIESKAKNKNHHQSAKSESIEEVNNNKGRKKGGNNAANNNKQKITNKQKTVTLARVHFFIDVLMTEKKI